MVYFRKQLFYILQHEIYQLKSHYLDLRCYLFVPLRLLEEKVFEILLSEFCIVSCDFYNELSALAAGSTAKITRRGTYVLG